jgi:epoxide hydrolase-like predicted phosphatase
MERAMMDYFYEQGYDMFDATIFSCAEGARKPEQRIYKIALDRLQAVPRETVFIDDKEENIAAAVELGIHGILFTSPEQVIKELVALSVGKTQQFPSAS